VTGRNLYFSTNGGDIGLAILNNSKVEVRAYSNANLDGFNVTLDSKGRNILTGHQEDGEEVILKALEIFEIECLNPPKQPEIP
jgi:hypothetical protein